jgi:hypothetical protein
VRARLRASRAPMRADSSRFRRNVDPPNDRSEIAARGSDPACRAGQGRQDSNLQPPVLETSGFAPFHGGSSLLRARVRASDGTAGATPRDRAAVNVRAKSPGTELGECLTRVEGAGAPQPLDDERGRQIL